MVRKHLGSTIMINCCFCRKYPGTTIVTDSVTSNGLTEFIEGLGGKHFRYRRGYKNVIGKGVELNEQGVPTELMMETRHALLCCFVVLGAGVTVLHA